MPPDSFCVFFRLLADFLCDYMIEEEGGDGPGSDPDFVSDPLFRLNITVESVMSS